MSGAAIEKPRSPSTSPENEKATRKDGSLIWNREDDSAIVRQNAENVKWIQRLEFCIDAIYESLSGDLGLVARNLVESATEMLVVAGEIRRRLRK